MPGEERDMSPVSSNQVRLTIARYFFGSFRELHHRERKVAWGLGMNISTC